MATRYPTEAYEENPDLEFSPQAGASATAPTGASIVTGASSPEPPAPPAPAPSFRAVPPTPSSLFPAPRPGFQLGGQPSDLTQVLQAQLLQQMQAPPRQWGALEGIGNVLGSVGAGMLGKTPAWMEQEELESTRRTKQVGQLLQVQDLSQRQQDRRQNAMVQVAELGLKFSALLPDEQDRSRGQFEAISRTILQSVGIPGFDDIVQDAYRPGNDQYREDLATPFTDKAFTKEEVAQYVRRISRVRGEKDRAALTTQFLAEKVESIAFDLQENLPTAAAELRAELKLPEDAQIEQGQLEVYLRRKYPERAGSKLTIKAWDALTASKEWAEKAVGMGVNPSSAKAKAAEAAQVEAAKLAVQGPKFHNLDPYPKTLIPYLTEVSGLTALQLDRIAATDPNRFAEIVKEAQKAEGAVLLERSTQQGAAKALVPEKASSAEREKLTSDITNVQLAIEMQKLYKPAYVGPITGRLGTYRSDYTGAMSEEEAQFRQSVTQFNNALIKELGGVVVPPAEFERIMAERPHLNLPPVTFEARAKQSRENMIFLAYVRRANMEKTGVDTSQLPPLPPLPKRFEGNPAVLGRAGKAPITEAPVAPKATAPPPVTRSGRATRVR